MHPALRLEEILLNIFGQCHSPCSTSGKHHASTGTADLAALARTCRTFKEPALDVLWTELDNLSPLARCLPDVSHRLYPGHAWYSFSRPLGQSEWETLLRYTRRVRSILDFTKGLNWDSVKILFNPPTPDAMFPNLRILRWEFIRETFPLMRHLAVPSLTSLDINFVFGDIPPFRSFPEPLGVLCPNIRQFRIRMRRPHADTDDAISGLVRHWRHLQVLYCPYISLDVDSLSHLSYTSSVTNLSFTLSPMVSDLISSSKSVLLFSKLRILEISSQSLDVISRLLPFIQLPAIESLSVFVDNCPSPYDLKSYLLALQKACHPDCLLCMRVIQTRTPTNLSTERYQLSLEDLRPCKAFRNLRRIDINTASTVKLSDKDLLELAPAWPYLEYLLINEEWGWKVEGGVTPNGLLQLLQKLQSLHHFCLAIDTRGFTDPPALESTGTARFTPRIPFSVNVADSVILPESVDALATFFGGIMRQHAEVSSSYWNTTAMADHMDSDISRRLWEDVFVKAHERVRVHSQSALMISEKA